MSVELHEFKALNANGIYHEDHLCIYCGLHKFNPENCHVDPPPAHDLKICWIHNYPLDEQGKCRFFMEHGDKVSG